MARNFVWLLVLCTSFRLHSGVVIDTGTSWLYSLTSGAQGAVAVEDFLFAEQLKDHDFPDNEMNYWDPHPTSGLRGQRVIRNNGSWSIGKPIFVHIGGEAPIHAGIIGPDTTLYQLAQDQSAMIVALEHRYYSNVANPTPELNQSTAFLLTVEQALDDAAHYIETLKKELGSSDSKVIAFGYFYGGNLAVWARSKYPSLFKGAVASGAPLLATYDFQQYFPAVQMVLGDECGGNILGNGMETLYQIIDGGNFDQLVADFGVDPTQVKDKDSAFSWVYDALITPIGLAVVQNKSQADVCGPLQNAFGSNGTSGGSGYRSIQVLYQHLQKLTKFPTSPAWVWHACSELGYFQSTYPASGHPFAEFKELNVTYLFQRACRALIENPLPPDTDQFNRKYQGLNISTTVSNVSFVQGRQDPWNTLGAGSSQDWQGIGPIYFEGCAHAPDFLWNNPACPNNALGLRQIRGNLTRWLGVPPVPWDHDSPTPLVSLTANEGGVMQVSAAARKGKQFEEIFENDPTCEGLFEIVVRHTRSRVKKGALMKLDFDVRITEPTVTDDLLVGVQYPVSDRVFFAKGSMSPQRKGEPIVPQDLPVHDIEGIYWDGVPTSLNSTSKWKQGARTSRHSFSTKFLVSPFYDAGREVELFPGACLIHTTGVRYCCKGVAVKADVKA